MSPSLFVTMNPATGEQIEEFAYSTPQETEAIIIARADKGFKSFSAVFHDCNSDGTRLRLLSSSPPGLA